MNERTWTGAGVPAGREIEGKRVVLYTTIRRYHIAYYILDLYHTALVWARFQRVGSRLLAEVGSS